MIVKLLVLILQLVLVYSEESDVVEMRKIQDEQDLFMIDRLVDEGFPRNIALLKVYGKKSSTYVELRTMLDEMIAYEEEVST